jgi:hypothetical protein
LYLLWVFELRGHRAKAKYFSSHKWLTEEAMQRCDELAAVACRASAAQDPLFA